MGTTKERKLQFTFTSIVLAYIISDNIINYLGLDRQGFSVDAILSIAILLICYFVINFLISKIAANWKKPKNSDK